MPKFLGEIEEVCSTHRGSRFGVDHTSKIPRRSWSSLMTTITEGAVRDPKQALTERAPVAEPPHPYEGHRRRSPPNLSLRRQPVPLGLPIVGLESCSDSDPVRRVLRPDRDPSRGCADLHPGRDPFLAHMDPDPGHRHPYPGHRHPYPGHMDPDPGRRDLCPGPYLVRVGQIAAGLVAVQWG